MRDKQFKEITDHIHRAVCEQTEAIKDHVDEMVDQVDIKQVVGNAVSRYLRDTIDRITYGLIVKLEGDEELEVFITRQVEQALRKWRQEELDPAPEKT